MEEFKIDIKKIKRFRLDNKFTQEEIGKYLQISKNGYSLKERGKRDFKPIELKALAELYETNVDDFFCNYSNLIGYTTTA
ncbi:MAG: helix-turn-helix transcriptional regulator [Firmicutes bacterium]|nr:helix-turn-helix transcriptional regulator [Bacillota bacterium]